MFENQNDFTTVNKLLLRKLMPCFACKLDTRLALQVMSERSLQFACSYYDRHGCLVMLFLVTTSLCQVGATLARLPWRRKPSLSFTIELRIWEPSLLWWTNCLSWKACRSDTSETPKTRSANYHELSQTQPKLGRTEVCAAGEESVTLDFASQ